MSEEVATAAGSAGVVIVFLVAIVGTLRTLTRVGVGTKVILLRFGKFQRVLDPGLHFLWPFENCMRVAVSEWKTSDQWSSLRRSPEDGHMKKSIWRALPTRRTMFDLPVCDIMSRDSVQCAVDISLALHVVDVKQFAFSAGDVGVAMLSESQAVLRRFCAAVLFVDLHRTLTIEPKMLVDELNASLFNFGVHIDGVHVDKVAIPKDYAELTAKMQQQTLQQRMLDDEATSTRRREQLAFDAVHGQTVQRQEASRNHLKSLLSDIRGSGVPPIHVAAIFHSQVLGEGLALDHVKAIYVPSGPTGAVAINAVNAAAAAAAAADGEPTPP